MAILFEVISVIGTVIWEMIKCFFHHRGRKFTLVPGNETNTWGLHACRYDSPLFGSSDNCCDGSSCTYKESHKDIITSKE